MAAILNGVGEFFTAIFSTNSTNPGYATQLVQWVTATGNELALIPLYLWIMIALVSVVRRLIPGV